MGKTLCSICVHARVCEELEEYRDPLYFEDANTGVVKCDYFDFNVVPEVKDV